MLVFCEYYKIHEKGLSCDCVVEVIAGVQGHAGCWAQLIEAGEQGCRDCMHGNMHPTHLPSVESLSDGADLGSEQVYTDLTLSV